MKVLLKTLPLICLCMLLLLEASAQGQEDSGGGGLYNRMLHFPDRLFKKVDGKARDIDSRLQKQTARYLSRLEKQERKLRKQLAGKDSMAAMRIFDDALVQYSALQTKVSSVSASASGMRSTYIPHLDSLKTAFGFVNELQSKLPGAADLQGKLHQATAHIEGLQSRFTQAQEVKRFIEGRQQFLREHLDRYGLGKELKSFRKQAYYYQAQVEEYRQLFSNPSRLEAKAIEVLQQSSRFKDFFARNSQLAALFRLPENGGGENVAVQASLAGMQTRASVTQELVQRFGSKSKMQEVMSRQLQSAQGDLSGLKDRIKGKINQLGGGTNSSDIEMPDFKPNDQKTKSFLNRLELGTNLQTVKAGRFFPSTTDIGLSVGYKLNDKSTIGIGGSYKMGWGRNIRHASVSHQGLGMRSFVDYRLKGSIWLSGGAEMNYRSEFKSVDVLKDYSAWQHSALLGLSKKYQVGKKLKGNMQVLYDFLWKRQVVHSQPVVFRLGYNLR